MRICDNWKDWAALILGALATSTCGFGVFWVFLDGIMEQDYTRIIGYMLGVATAAFAWFIKSALNETDDWHKNAPIHELERDGSINYTNK